MGDGAAGRIIVGVVPISCSGAATAQPSPLAKLKQCIKLVKSKDIWWLATRAPGHTRRPPPTRSRSQDRTAHHHHIIPRYSSPDSNSLSYPLLPLTEKQILRVSAAENVNLRVVGKPVWIKCIVRAQIAADVGCGQENPSWDLVVLPVEGLDGAPRRQAAGERSITHALLQSRRKVRQIGQVVVVHEAIRGYEAVDFRLDFGLHLWIIGHQLHKLGHC